MITLTKWIYILKHYLKCDIPQKQLRIKIINECTNGKVHNTYNVDKNQIWEKIITKNKNCMGKIRELKCNDVIDLESYYEEQEYHKMWLDYRCTYKKRRR